MPSLPELIVGPAARHGGVTALPVFATVPLPHADYELGTAAMTAGTLEVEELPRRPTVGQLQARNRGRSRLLLVDGDHLIGAHQNRMLTSSVLIGGKQKLALPVSCVEQRRWRGDTPRFQAGVTGGSAGLRAIAKQTVTRSLLENRERSADQARIWSHITRQQHSLRVRSATAALAHTYAARAADIATITDRLPYRAGAIGIALGIGGALVSLDLFDNPVTCERYWRRLVEGAALEGLDARRSLELGGGEVLAMLDELRRADWSRVPAVGDGEELRTCTPRCAASLLLLDGKLVHFGFAPDPGDDAGRDALDSRTAVMRHDLPDVLAARYRIVGRLGVGGAKEVFRASCIGGGPDVAIARIPGADPELFEAELAQLRRVHSVYVPAIVDALVDEYGDAYLVMERCDGPSLAELVAHGPLSIADASPILVAFARGVRDIHERAVLHRDLKLENVMLHSSDAGSQLKILDFGLAARARGLSTDVGRVNLAGTLPYMAREVLIGERIDARADVFAFGVCCYRILTGELPTPPLEHETELDYLMRLRSAAPDVSRLPAELPAPVRATIARMLAPAREQRPFMPEVVAAFEQAFGAQPIGAPRRFASARPRNPLERTSRIPLAVARPEHLIVAACPHAPLVVLTPEAASASTEVRAFGTDGKPRWIRRLEGCFTTGLRADLDGDGVRELYLAGPDRVAAIDAGGRVRFSRPTGSPSTLPDLLALPDRAAPRLVVEGQTFDPRTGAQRGPMPLVYQGDGHQLMPATEPRGLSYNGYALQGFRGAHGTAAAIVLHPGAARFEVAQLEETRSGRVQVAIYGPGGVRLHAGAVSACQLDTGDVAAISNLYDRRPPLFGAEHAPLAVLGPGATAAVIVPLLAPAPGVVPTLVAFERPSGRELWRHAPEATGDGRALLADLRGDGKPQLVVGDGRTLVVYDAWTGAASEPHVCTGAPVAFGDPFVSGFAHVITASPGGVELWRASPCVPGTMAWSGPRGDLWRTGTLRRDGVPLGPL